MPSCPGTKDKYLTILLYCVPAAYIVELWDYFGYHTLSDASGVYEFMAGIADSKSERKYMVPGEVMLIFAHVHVMWRAKALHW